MSLTPAEAVTRFMPQIKSVASYTARKFPGFEEDDFLDYAVERVMVYAGEPVAGDAEAGRLPQWEETTGAQDSQLKKLIAWALTCDLKDYADKMIRQNRRSGMTGLSAVPDYSADLVPSGSDGYGKKFRVKDDEPDGSLEAYPLLALKYGQDMTQEEIADELRISLRTVQRKLAAELARYKSDNAIAA
jgi:hypothetical protein